MEKLLKNIKNKTYCRIKSSKVNGVGVFAIKDIPINTNPFYLTDNKLIDYKYKKISKTDLKNVDSEVMKMIDDFLYKEDDDSYYIPLLGLNSLDISFYMNHSFEPNIKIVKSYKYDTLIFKTNRKIKKDEELLINYDNYDNF